MIILNVVGNLTVNTIKSDQFYISATDGTGFIALFDKNLGISLTTNTLFMGTSVSIPKTFQSNVTNNDLDIIANLLQYKTSSNFRNDGYIKYGCKYERNLIWIIKT